MTFQLSSIREGGFTKTFFVISCLHVSPCVKVFPDYVKKKNHYTQVPQYQPRRVLKFPAGFYRAITTGHHSVRHRRLQGIPTLNIAFCTGKGNKTGVKSEELKEWKTIAAEVLYTHVTLLCDLFLSAVQLGAKHHLQSSDRN